MPDLALLSSCPISLRLRIGSTGTDNMKHVGWVPSDADAENVELDHEMESELVAGLREDPLAAYDVDVTREGAAIQEYLTLLRQQQFQHQQHKP